MPIQNLIVANGLPIYMRKEQRHLMSIGSQTSSKLILTIKPCIGPRDTSVKFWSPRMEATSPQNVVIEENDVVKGATMLDPNCSYVHHQLEQIDEDSECNSSDLSTDDQKYDMKLCKTQINVHRLDGGCFPRKKKKKCEEKDVDDAYVPAADEQALRQSLGSQSQGRRSSLTPSVHIAEEDEQKPKVDGIDCLEKQVQQLNEDLNMIRKQMVPPENLALFGTLATNLYEVNYLLSDLKLNCLRLNERQKPKENVVQCCCQNKLPNDGANTTCCSLRTQETPKPKENVCQCNCCSIKMPEIQIPKERQCNCQNKCNNNGPDLTCCSIKMPEIQKPRETECQCNRPDLTCCSINIPEIHKPKENECQCNIQNIISRNGPNLTYCSLKTPECPKPKPNDYQFNCQNTGGNPNLTCCSLKMHDNLRPKENDNVDTHIICCGHQFPRELLNTNCKGSEPLDCRPKPKETEVYNVSCNMSCPVCWKTPVCPQNDNTNRTNKIIIQCAPETPTPSPFLSCPQKKKSCEEILKPKKENCDSDSQSSSQPSTLSSMSDLDLRSKIDECQRKSQRSERSKKSRNAHKYRTRRSQQPEEFLTSCRYNEIPEFPKIGSPISTPKYRRRSERKQSSDCQTKKRNSYVPKSRGQCCENRSADSYSIMENSTLEIPKTRRRNSSYSTRRNNDKNSECRSRGSSNDIPSKYPVIKENLMEAIKRIIQNHDPFNIALTFILKPNGLYHINISVTTTGQSLGDIYATECALEQAENDKLFDKFLTFFVLNSNFTPKQKSTILGHSFQFIDTGNSCQNQSNSKNNSNSSNHKRDNSKLRLQSSFTQVLHQHFRDNNLVHTTSLLNTSRSIEISPISKRRLHGGSSKEYIPNQEQIRVTQGGNGQYNNMSNFTYNRNEDKSERIRNLEIQVRKLREELNHIREELVPQEDIIKFSHLSERLRELNELLRDLRKNYQDVNGLQEENDNNNGNQNVTYEDEDEEREDYKTKDFMVDKTMNNSNEIEEQRTEDNGYSSLHLDNLDIRSNDRYIMNLFPDPATGSSNKKKLPPDNYAPPDTEENKRFGEEIQNPRNLLERHLLMMRDFRADADLRRQRLERKRQEKMQQIQSKLNIGKINEEREEPQECETDNLRQSINNIRASYRQSKVSSDENPGRPYNRQSDGMSKRPSTRQSSFNEGMSKRLSNRQSTYNDDTSERPSNRPSNYNGGNPSNRPSIYDEGMSKRPSSRQSKIYNNSQGSRVSQINSLRLPNASKDTQTEDVSSAESESPRDIQTDSLNHLDHDKGSQTSLLEPIIESNLQNALIKILQENNTDISSSVLSITLGENDQYHINVWTTVTGKSLGNLYATEAAIQEAEDQRVFNKFLTYIVLNETNTLEQKRRLLEHSYQIISGDK